jgi:exodeoxyribonuclease VII small subunit
MAGKLPTFEESLANLEAIIAELEAGTLPLDKMMARYEQGVKMLAQCRAVLDKAEKQIEILVKSKDGSLSAEPFEPPDDD